MNGSWFLLTIPGFSWWATFWHHPALLPFFANSSTFARKIDAELQPALDQLRGCTSFNAANLEARAAALTAELRRLGMDLHGSEGSGSPSSEAWQAAQMASLWGHGDLSGRAAVTAARQKLMAEASAMLDEVGKTRFPSLVPHFILCLACTRCCTMDERRKKWNWLPPSSLPIP